MWHWRRQHRQCCSKHGTNTPPPSQKHCHQHHRLTFWGAASKKATNPQAVFLGCAIKGGNVTNAAGNKPSHHRHRLISFLGAASGGHSIKGGHQCLQVDCFFEGTVSKEATSPMLLDMQQAPMPQVDWVFFCFGDMPLKRQCPSSNCHHCCHHNRYCSCSYCCTCCTSYPLHLLISDSLLSFCAGHFIFVCCSFCCVTNDVAAIVVAVNGQWSIQQKVVRTDFCSLFCTIHMCEVFL